MAEESTPTPTSSPLFLESWLKFNQATWDLRPLRLKLAPENKPVPSLETVLYLDQRGRVALPLINPHLPVQFSLTSTERAARVSRQRQSLLALLAEELKTRGVRGKVCFDPQVDDMREFQWRGLEVEVRYTFHVSLPFDETQVSKMVKNRIARGAKEGFVCEAVDANAAEDLWECMRQTECRQKFSHGLRNADVANAFSIVDAENLRVYACRSSATGEVAAFRAVLIGGAQALDLIACVKDAFLSTGCVQYLFAHVVRDVGDRGVTCFDMVGANLPSVSASKREWGGTLVPYYSIGNPLPVALSSRVSQTAQAALRRVTRR